MKTVNFNFSILNIHTMRIPKDEQTVIHQDCCDNYCGKYTSSVQNKYFAISWHLYS